MDHHYKVLLLIQFNARDLYEMTLLDCVGCFSPGQLVQAKCIWAATICKEVVAVLLVNEPYFILLNILSEY